MGSSSRFVVDKILVRSRVLDLPVSMILRDTGVVEIYVVDEGMEKYAGNLRVDISDDVKKVSSLIAAIRDRIKILPISRVSLRWLQALSKANMLDLWEDPPVD